MSIAGLLSIVASIPAPAFGDDTQQPAHEAPAAIGPEEIDRLNAAASAVLKWIDDEQIMQPGLPTVHDQKIPEKVLCDKLAEALPDEDRADDRLLVMRWSAPSVGNGGTAQDEDALSPYFLVRALKQACEKRELHIYDPRSPDAPAPDTAAPAAGSGPDFEEGYPACRNGPTVTIRREDSRALITAMNSFDRLKRVGFACIGAKRVINNPFLLAGRPIALNTPEFLLVNTKLFFLDLRDAKIGHFKVVGTVAPPAADPAAANRGPDLDAPQPAYPGSRIDNLVLSASQIEQFRISGTAVGSLIVGDSRISGDAVIARSEFGALVMSGSKLKNLNLYQLRIGKGTPERGHTGGIGSIHLTNNDIADDLRIGALDDVGAAMTSLAPAGVDEMTGPAPPWLADEPNVTVRLRGYVTLAKNRISGQLLVSGLSLAGRQDGALSESASRPGDGEAFFNINGLSARSIVVSGSVFNLGSNASFLGQAVTVQDDVIFASNSLHKLNGDNISPERVNRMPISSGVSSERSIGPALLGLTQLSARSIVFVNNLVLGPIALVDPTVRDVAILTTPVAAAKSMDWFDFCVRPRERDDAMANVAGRFAGGAVLLRHDPMPLAAISRPTCYGSIQIQRGTIDSIGANGLLSDLVITGTQVRFGIGIAGRVSGVVNFANVQTRDGVVSLGETQRPLQWCSEGQLLMDGVRIAAFQADRASFIRYDCDAPTPAVVGPLRMSLRAARIDQIMGQARITMSDPADAGLLGLGSEALKVIAAPVLSDTPADDDLDPQTLSFLATRLREAGFVAKANDLAMERVSRQKWSSPAPIDHLKWVLGWPIGWGYQTEWAFIYAAFFVVFGAWVSAYYRTNPDHSPPEATWLTEALKARGSLAGRAKSPKPIKGLAVVLATVAFPVLAILWVSPTFALTQDQTLIVVGVVILFLALYHLNILAFFQRRSWKLRLLRFGRAAGNIDYHSFFFSLDRFLPSPGFHAYWGNYPRIGQAGRNYFYLHRMIGLVLISIAAAGAAGLFE
jgi:hypothetical protein